MNDSVLNFQWLSVKYYQVLLIFSYTRTIVRYFVIYRTFIFTMLCIWGDIKLYSTLVWLLFCISYVCVYMVYYLHKMYVYNCGKSLTCIF